MAALLLGILVLAHWDGGLVSGSLFSYSKVCGSDKVEYLESPDGGHHLSINGRRVEDHLLMCQALESYLNNGCFICDSSVEAWERMEQEYCNQDITRISHGECGTSSVYLAKRVGRKLLYDLPANASWIDRRSERGQSEEGKQEDLFSSKEQDIPLVIPGMVLLCCGILCPCFQAKKKEALEENDQSRQLNSMDSVSSVDINTGSGKASTTPRVPPSHSRFSLSPQLSRIASINLTLDQIIKATQNFSPSLKLGERGFGTVYKGFLPDGRVVAFKRAKKEQISTLREEFSNEVELLAKIEHRNLVRLLGYNDNGNECIIITEYVPNGTLRDHLDGQFGKILDFNQRLGIAIDVAHGLTYLHLYAEKMIIHRDVKSSNILLTESYTAKVSDFGFARSGPADSDQTHISTKVKGTAGYLDPEYLRTYELTPKSDVFSFGILLLEIISGRRPVDLKRSLDERITVRWAFNKYNEGNLTDILDPLLEEKVDEEVLGRLLTLAFNCAAPTRSDRPDMKVVGEQLWQIRKEYLENIKRT